MLHVCIRLLSAQSLICALYSIGLQSCSRQDLLVVVSWKLYKIVMLTRGFSQDCSWLTTLSPVWTQSHCCTLDRLNKQGNTVKLMHLDDAALRLSLILTEMWILSMQCMPGQSCCQPSLSTCYYALQVVQGRGEEAG